MKKYIHRNTKVIGELKEDCHVHFQRCYGNVCSSENMHMDFVINSNDWEELKEPDALFITEDNVKITLTNERLFGVLPKGQWQTNFYDGKGIPVHLLLPINKNKSWLWFSTKQAALDYILLYKPTISINDFLDFVEEPTK